MASRAESEKPWDIGSFSPERHPMSPPEFAKNAEDLADFLSGSPIDLINVDAVISIVRLEPMYMVTIGRTIEKDANGVIIGSFYTTNNVSVRMLETSICLMSKKQRKKHTGVSENINFIKKIIHDPANWGKPFNFEKDN